MLNHSKYSDLTAKQYEAIGKISVEWSNVEFLMGILLSRLLFTPEFLGRTYTDEMSAVRLEAAIKNALKIHRHRYGSHVIDHGTTEEIEIVLRRVGKYRVARNKFAHYLWSRNNDDTIIGFKMSGKLPDTKNPNKDSASLTLLELKELHLELYDLSESLSNIVSSLPKVDEESNLTKRCSRPGGLAAF